MAAVVGPTAVLENALKSPEMMYEELYWRPALSVPSVVERRAPKAWRPNRAPPWAEEPVSTFRPPSRTKST